MFLVWKSFLLNGFFCGRYPNG